LSSTVPFAVGRMSRLILYHHSRQPETLLRVAWIAGRVSQTCVDTTRHLAGKSLTETFEKSSIVLTDEGFVRFEKVGSPHTHVIGRVFLLVARLGPFRYLFKDIKPIQKRLQIER
jgi:hypothetical protein